MKNLINTMVPAAIMVGEELWGVGKGRNKSKQINEIRREWLKPKAYAASAAAPAAEGL